jgi:endonuclease III
MKSKDIKGILEMVYKEGQARRNALLAAKREGGEGPAGAENETEEEKYAEVARAEENVLSLQHLHTMSADDAMSEMIKYPGIGPKTASCVLLFCLRRPSFAVDTHVFRICRWLNWVPANATRNTAYSHCEVRVPDQLKYPLHQLMIFHGKKCPRCRAATGEGSEGWDDGCPIEHLVTRTGKRKQKGMFKKAKRSQNAGGTEEDQVELEDNELTEPGEDADEMETDDLAEED